MKVGYARVSSATQSLNIQRDKLNSVCEELFEEKISGTNKNRPALERCLQFVRKGDVLVITKLDRLARSVAHLNEIATLLSKKGVELEVLDQHIDTSTPTGRLLFNVLGAIAEFENDIRKERQREGIERAKSEGKYNRDPILNAMQIEKLKELREKGLKVHELCKEFKCRRSTVYAYLKK